LGNRVVTFSRSVTIAGWIVIAAAFAVAWTAVIASHRRFPSGVALTHVAMRHVAVRIFALAAWAWIGWHFFVRTSR
jgi:hypothetical protein